MKWKCEECKDTTLKSLGHINHQDFDGCSEEVSPTDTTVECLICPNCGQEHIELWDELEFA